MTHSPLCHRADGAGDPLPPSRSLVQGCLRWQTFLWRRILTPRCLTSRSRGVLYTDPRVTLPSTKSGSAVTCSPLRVPTGGNNSPLRSNPTLLLYFPFTFTPLLSHCPVLFPNVSPLQLPKAVLTRLVKNVVRIPPVPVGVTPPATLPPRSPQPPPPCRPAATGSLLHAVPFL